MTGRNYLKTYNCPGVQINRYSHCNNCFCSESGFANILTKNKRHLITTPKTLNTLFKKYSQYQCTCVYAFLNYYRMVLISYINGTIAYLKNI